jgi:HlyD family secretion protein
MPLDSHKTREEQAPVAARSTRAAGKALLVVGAVALGALGGYGLHDQLAPSRPPPATPTAVAPAPWVAAAAGRVEPRFGEFRVGTSLLGRVAEVLVRVNDRVEEGDLLVRLEDDEARARLMAAEAEASSRRRERDAQAATAGREELGRAEDELFAAERDAAAARFELDSAPIARRTANGADQRLVDARRRFLDARERLQRASSAFDAAQARPGLPAPNRSEASLSAARAEVTAAQALLDKTRIRAPAAGAVLQLNARVGEMVAPASDQPLAVIGDLSAMRVKAEIAERDVPKVKLGQRAIARSDAYPGRDFEGQVSALAPSLSAPRIGARGPRRPAEVEVLEATIDLAGTVPLMPGMRVDVFFRRDH